MTKLLFLPQCLRPLYCGAEMTKQGYNCNSNCSQEHPDCVIGQIKDKAEQKHYSIFIVPGGEMVKKIMQNTAGIDYLVGVACQDELEIAQSYIPKLGLEDRAAAVLLLKSDCAQASEVNIEDVIKALK